MSGSKSAKTPTTFEGAAILVLRRHRRPLTSREITQDALALGLIKTKGRTPQATMAARLYVGVRDHPEGPLVKLSDPGTNRARRGSVKWALRDYASKARG
jgi:hypothetical protein